MPKLYGKNQMKKLIDGHNEVVVAKINAKINFLNKVVGLDRNYITDVIAKEWMGRMIPVPTLVYSPWSRDSFFAKEYQKPIKHQKNFELIMLEWCYDEPEPVRP